MHERVAALVHRCRGQQGDMSDAVRKELPRSSEHFKLALLHICRNTDPVCASVHAAAPGCRASHQRNHSISLEHSRAVWIWPSTLPQHRW